MSATFAMTEQADGLEKLLTLATLNKDTIAAAGAEARKQLQLTEAERGNVEAAKTYITQHKFLVANLQSREDALATTIAAHAKEKEDFFAHVAAENTRLENFAATLTAREAAVGIAEKQNSDATRSLSDTRAAQYREHQEAMANVEITKKANDAAVATNAAEAVRLREWEAVLKAKAQRIKTEAANF